MHLTIAFIFAALAVIFFGLSGLLVSSGTPARFNWDGLGKACVTIAFFFGGKALL